MKMKRKFKPGVVGGGGGLQGKLSVVSVLTLIPQPLCSRNSRILLPPLPVVSKMMVCEWECKKG